MEKLRVDIIIPTAYKGGVENVVNMTALYLKQQGMDVRIIQIVGDNSWCDPSLETYIISREAGVFQLNELSQEYAELLRKKDVPDLILCTVWPVMCTAAKMALELLELGKTVKIVSWMHHGSVMYVDAAGWGGYDHLQNADYHLAINSYLEKEICENIPNSLVFRILNPVDLDKYKLTRKEDIQKHDKLQIIYVGRISSEKRLDVIIQALAYAKGECELHVVGSTPGEYEDLIRNMVVENELENQVFWYEWMENPWQNSKDMDVCVMASEVEGFPLVAIEALANGLPLFTTPVEGMEELIEDGVNGYLYPFEDSITLGKLFIAMKRELLPQMLPQNCEKTVQKYHYKSALADFYEKIGQIIE